MINNIELYGFLNGTWDVTEIVPDGDNKTIYQGKPATSSAVNTDPVWCIRKITITNANGVEKTVVTYADGNLLYDNIWEDRETLTYNYLG